LSIFDDLLEAEEHSFEKILSQLLDTKKVELHTEINQPVAITGLDTLAFYFKDVPVVHKLLKYALFRLRINYVPFKRKRAEEIIEAVKKAREEEKEKDLKKLLLG